MSCSDLTVVTRHASQSVGSRLIFDTRGVLQHQEACAREVTDLYSVTMVMMFVYYRLVPVSV